jgi:hypothetical protein
MKKVISLVLGLLVSLILLLPIQIQAAGVAIGPQTLEVNNAIRGGDYEKVVTVFNPSNYQDNFRIGADGQAGSWLSFYKWNIKQDLANQTPLQTFAIDAGSNTPILLKIKVPQDAANGSYKATVFAETAPVGLPAGSQVSAVMRSEAFLTIAVSGNMIVGGTVNNVSVPDAEAGFPVRLEINFKNTGNVAVQPEIDYQVMKGTTKVAEDSYNKTSVGAGSTADIAIELATSPELAGDYSSHVSVSVQGKNLATKDLSFKILPAGTFTKKGELASFQYEGNTLQNSMVKLQAGFKNTGQGDARAKLISEVYVGTDLVDTIKSEDSVVAAGDTGNLTAYLKLSTPGQYTIKGYISYEGKQTETKEISLNVAAAGTSQVAANGASNANQSKPISTDNPAGLPFNPLYFVAVAACIGIALFFTLRKRSQKRFKG